MNRVLAGIGIVVTLVAAGLGGYALGQNSGADLDAARAEGEAAGREAGAKQGSTEGYAAGLASGQRQGYSSSYATSYRAAYRQAYEDTGAGEAPEQISVPSQDE